MKKLTCLLLFALCLESVKAQVIPPNVGKPELWESSRRLRRTGFFLLGAGVVTTLVGVGKAYGETLNSFWGGTPKPGNSSTILTGGLIIWLAVYLSLLSRVKRKEPVLLLTSLRT